MGQKKWLTGTASVRTHQLSELRKRFLFKLVVLWAEVEFGQCQCQFSQI